MKIGLDFDGVIANYPQLKALAAKELFGLDLPASWMKKEILLEKGLLDPEQYRAAQEEACTSRRLTLLMEAMPGAITGIMDMQAAGHTLTVITSRHGQGLALAREWLTSHGLTLPCVGVGYGVSKAEAAREQRAFIDDSPDKLAQLVGTVPHLYLYSWEYHAGRQLPASIRQVDSWARFQEEVSRLHEV